MELPSENYQLKWHSFGSYLHGCIASAVHGGDSFADVSLMTMDGRQIQAHRLILSASSQYLHQVLKLHTKLAAPIITPLSIVLPPEINYKTLKVLVEYMYSGETTVSQDILESVLKGGDLLKVRGLWRPKEETSPPEKHMNIKLHSSPPKAAKQTSLNNATTDSLLSTQSVIKESKKTNKEVSAKANPEESVIKSVQDSNGNETQNKFNGNDQASKDLTQLLEVKEEPIEWTEVNQDEIELVEREEIFDSEMVIKPEVQMDEDDEGDNNAEHAESLYTPLTCELCSETFNVPGDWVKHVQSHTDMMPAKRQKRGRPSSDDDNKNFPPLQCDMCHEYFLTPAKWVQHIQNAHTEQEMHALNNFAPKQPVVSSLIRASTTATSLTATVTSTSRTSSTKKVCSVCNKTFPSHASMLIHKRTHTGERPYMCDYCCKGFNVKSNLLRHLRTLHDRFLNPAEIESKDDALQ